MQNTSNINSTKSSSLISHESVETAVVKAVESALQTLEPQLKKYATQFAHQAVDKGQDVAERAYRRVQRQPLMLLGIAAIALAGVAVTMFAQNRSFETNHQIH